MNSISPSAIVDRLTELSGACASPINVEISDIKDIARDVRLYELRNVTNGTLPDAAPGAHLDVNLGNGLVRQYSLLRAAKGADCYEIAVKRDPAGRGGSQYISETFFSGKKLTISGPRNNFPLAEEADRSILVAGGIGITPILAMVRRLHELGRSWRLYYASRTPQDAAFANELERIGHTHFHFDSEQQGMVLDVAGIVHQWMVGTHLYCCGPLPMLKAFTTATRDIDKQWVHLEHFAPEEQQNREGGYWIAIAKTGQRLWVDPGETVLEVLRRAGFDLPTSCEQGVCGTCETRVVAGIPDHRDSVLSASEREANATMMICCSGSKSEEIVLDL